MGQQPNVELRIEDLPRPTAHPAPARRWSPDRPGELTAPGEVPWGGMYGTPGPNTGYAHRLLSELDLPLPEGESRADIEAALGAIVAARASRFGRAPTAADVDVALLIIGLSEDVPETVAEDLAESRRRWSAGLAHKPHRVLRLVAAVPNDVLDATLEELQERSRAGDRLTEL